VRYGRAPGSSESSVFVASDPVLPRRITDLYRFDLSSRVSGQSKLLPYGLKAPAMPLGRFPGSAVCFERLLRRY
jgi:hypothetical protein